jgi:hypothetical protein
MDFIGHEPKLEVDGIFVGTGLSYLYLFLLLAYNRKQAI